MTTSKNIAILGASGYTGAELVRLIATHPQMEIKALTADRKAGLEYGQVFPHLRHLDLPKLTTIAEVDFTDIDMVFCALPHATSQEVIGTLPTHVKIVDLSADFASVIRKPMPNGMVANTHNKSCKKKRFTALPNITGNRLKPHGLWRELVVMR